MAKTAPQLDLDLGAAGKPVSLTFRSIDDFHPDTLHSRVEAFSDCFDRDEKTALMNAILHHPATQSLEASWRGLDWLLLAIAKCGPIEVRLIDLSAEELIADLQTSEKLEESGLYQILVDQPASKGDPRPVVCHRRPLPVRAQRGPRAQGPRSDREDRPAKLGAVFGRGPPASPRGVFQSERGRRRGLDDAPGGKLPEGPALLGLATPRFLLRPPYGEATRTIDAFEYEEYTGPAGWKGYLWGSSALACAVLLARSFAKENWAFKPGSILDLGGMTMHVTKDEDDEPVSVLAEARLIRPSAERLSGLGLMPLLCVKGRDAAELAGVQSLAQPPNGEKTSALLGRWGQKGSVVLPQTGSAPKVAAAAVASAAPPAAPGPAQEAEPEPAAATEAEMDPELAALMAELDAPAAEPEPAAATEDEMDPELRCGPMAELDSPPHLRAAEPAAPAAEEDMDPELAAPGSWPSLDAPRPSPRQHRVRSPSRLPNRPEESAEEEMDPELAALMAELDAPTCRPPSPALTTTWTRS